MDDTERKRAEEQLKVYAAELERSNRELEGFASIASHDLMEPLRKITSFGERVMELVPQLEGKPKDYSRRMQHAAERMNLLVEDLLTLSKVQRKAQPFMKVDLNLIVSDVKDNLEKLIRETGGKIKVDQLPSVFGEPFQIMQLFQNLIANGLKFCSSEQFPKIQIHCRDLGKEGFEFIVEDNGIGFNQKYSERIFRTFERIHGYSEYEGTGMGLSICKKIIELHNGTIRAESEEGKGAKFIFTLPDKQRE